MRLKLRQRSNQRVLFDKGQWQLSLIESARKQAQTSRKSGDWITHVDICHALKGMSLDDCSNIAAQCKAGKILSRKLRLKLCNMTLAGSLVGEAALADRQALYKELIGNRSPSLVSVTKDILTTGYLGSFLFHYPALLTELLDNPSWGMGLNWSNKEYCRLAMNLKETTISLPEGLRQILDLSDGCRHDYDDQSATVAVVGNSPGLLGQGKGEEIDSHDLVVRFNRVSAEPDQAVHTGKRTDIWVMSPSTPVQQCPPDARLIMVSGLHSLTRPSFYWRTLSTHGKPLAEFDASVWYELVERFNAPPSAGTLAIAALQKTRADLRIQRFGFTTAHGLHGTSANHHNDQAKVSSRHNWQAEVDWLRDSVS